MDLLVQCPDSPRRAEKVEDLSLLFIHIHHLLNEFRPHQARETLRVMMELQRRQRVETAVRFQKHLDKVILLFFYFIIIYIRIEQHVHSASGNFVCLDTRNIDTLLTSQVVVPSFIDRLLRL